MPPGTPYCNALGCFVICCFPDADGEDAKKLMRANRAEQSAEEKPSSDLDIVSIYN